MSINHFSSEHTAGGLWWTQAQGMMDPTPNIPSSKYKGVVPQPNGRWGAQIYENHHRVWLGTFDTEEAAAQSYDRAAAMFRGPEAALNFQQNEDLNGNYEEDEEQQPQQQQISPQQESITEVVEEEEEEEEEEREAMFEKPLTPSDVGKLNRLVIPKQHAEKYFPLGGDSSEKGLLLSFEDESGKLWRFRYSYWNSSQSYVLTKGWSRFVKEKHLDAGDVVLFERSRLDRQRLFILWRRRPAPVQDSGVAQAVTAPIAAWTHFYSAHPYPSHPHGPLSYQPECLHAVEPPVRNPPTTPGNSKRLRLFGVNLDCQLDESDSPRPDGSSLSSQGGTHLFYSQLHDSNHSNHQDLNFSGDVNRTRNGPGGDLSM